MTGPVDEEVGKVVAREALVVAIAVRWKGLRRRRSVFLPRFLLPPESKMESGLWLLAASTKTLSYLNAAAANMCKLFQQ